MNTDDWALTLRCELLTATYLISHRLSQEPREVSTIIIFNLQTRKLNREETKYCPRAVSQDLGLQSRKSAPNPGLYLWYCTPMVLEHRSGSESLRDLGWKQKGPVPTFLKGAWASRFSLVVISEPSQSLSLGGKGPLEEETATHSSALAWKIPGMEEPGGLQAAGSWRVGHDWATSLLQFASHYGTVPIPSRVLPFKPF